MRAENFAGLFRSMAKAVEAFDCDLVLVSGKPSSGRRRGTCCGGSRRHRLSAFFFTKDAYVGARQALSWIVEHDAEMVTVAGAACTRHREAAGGPGPAPYAPAYRIC